ncbi:DNA-binding IclR family transcriptional regulator [Arthrobacter sp. GAS37]|uniref:IclR family transcriptional regulator n=1 Tax=Arthrobacter sp. GAS37 TaxID=3156261 RepID=UPI003838F74E
MTETTADSRTAGGRTLARGLKVLKTVVAAPDGMSVQEVADMLEVHRSMAYRVLNTISDQNLLVRGHDGRYRASAALLDLAAGAQMALRTAARPFLQQLADDIQCTLSLFIKEGEEAVALSVVEPSQATWTMSYSFGSRLPLTKGAAPYAIRSLLPERPDEPEAVKKARSEGYASTFSEVEPNLYAVAVPLRGLGPNLVACICLITNRPEPARESVEAIREAAELIALSFRGAPG